MNSAQILYERFGIISELDSFGHVRFGRLGKWAQDGDLSAWQEIVPLLSDVEQNAKSYLRRDDRIIVTGDRQVLVLHPSEVRQVLTNDPALYVKALRRGKAEKRTQATERRR